MEQYQTVGKSNPTVATPPRHTKKLATRSWVLPLTGLLVIPIYFVTAG